MLHRGDQMYKFFRKRVHDFVGTSVERAGLPDPRPNDRVGSSVGRAGPF